MSKNLKLSIKNKQLADSLNLGKLKDKFNKKKTKEEPVEEEKPKKQKAVSKVDKQEPKPEVKVEAPKADTSDEVKSKQKEEPADDKPILEKPAVRAKSETKGSKDTIAKREHIKELEDSSPELQTKSSLKKGSFKGEKPLGRLAGKPNKGYQDLPPLRRQNPGYFDARSRQGLISPDEGTWQRKRRRPFKRRAQEEDTTIRPSELTIRVPISIKNLAAQMKVKAAELITVLFKQGLAVTLNDYLEDETTIQLLGHELNCEITLNTAEQERVQITDKTLSEEISATDPKKLKNRPPVVTFMGHVDHGKTSLIDAIRKSNRVAYEAGAITQHIGAFQCNTSHGPITILDTPGHEAFSAMRNRGATVTDIVVLVIAGDEGIKDQTIEAIQQAKAALGVTILVALNKCDKEGFNPDEIYRGLAEHELIPEQWGGSTVTINCSAKTGEGIPELLELIALQSEILELKANPNFRARGMVLESEIHKGMGTVATLIVQNGTLNIGDALVFDSHYAKIKTMINDLGDVLQHATPSTPVEITGISGLPEAGSEFIVVKDEKEAKDISQIRQEQIQKHRFNPKKKNLQESFLSEDHDKPVKKVLPLIIRADVQGSLEALKQSLMKIKSDKVEVLIIDAAVGEVTESDIHLAKTSGASIIGFHTRIESHAEELIKSINVDIKMPKIIYEAVDQVKDLMIAKLDKIPKEEDQGKAEIRAIFKASRIGKIAGCQVLSGLIKRNHKARVVRDGKVIWKGAIGSLKREKEDVKELKKDMECGIVLEKFNDIQVGDVIESFEVTYLTPTL